MDKFIEEGQQLTSCDAIPITEVPSLGDIIKDGRHRYDLTQSGLAQRTGTSNVEISRVENSFTKRPPKDFVKKISPYTGYSYTQLLPIAGYSTDDHEIVYYDTQMEKIDYLDIIQDIYRADADLLNYFAGLHEFTSLEDIKMLKLLLKLMRRISTCKEEPSNQKKESFSKFKMFLSSYLPVLLES